MATVFDYNISQQERNLLNIPTKESYMTPLNKRKAFYDLCNLLKGANDCRAHDFKI